MKQRRHMRTIRKVFVASVFALLLVGLARLAAAQSEVGTVASVTGVVDVERGKSGPRAPLTVGAPVFVGDRIRTGAESEVTVVFGDDSVVDVGEQSDLILEQLTVDREARRYQALLRLQNGKLRATASDYYAEPGTRFEIETPTAVARLHGAAIVTYSPRKDYTEVVGLDRDTEVVGTISLIGAAVQVHPQELCRISKGRLPSPPERAEHRVLADYSAGLGAVGTGTRDTLDLGHAVVTGQLVPAGDRPTAPAPPGAPAVAPGEPQPPYLKVSVPSQTLAQRLFPDNWIIEQPIPEYLVSDPDIAPPPVP